MLALTTAILWGLLPIALKGVMQTLDPITTTFFRFFLAAVLLTPYILLKHKNSQMPEKGSRFRSPKLLMQLLAAGLLLAGNYALYILGLEKTTAEAAQVMIQVAPMLLLLSGLWVFGEHFSRTQWLGFLSFALGLVLFFYHRLHDLFFAFSDYGVGMLLVFVAALLWTGYGILQKFLLKAFSSQETMVIFYWIGAVSFLPFSDFSKMAELSQWQWGLLIFCGLNTLIAYGSFAEALAHIEASKVSAVIALPPVFTVAAVHIIPIEGIVVEALGVLSVIGGVMVVGGSMVTALYKQQPQPDPKKRP